jgi:cytochrome o ubiquinol oxidase subunit 2
MHFPFQSLTADDFDKWVAQIKAGGGALGRSDYLELEKPSENVPARGYASVAPGLYNAIVNECVEPGKMCLNQMAEIDRKGGLGLKGINNVLPLAYDKFARRGALGPEATYVASLCDPEHPMGVTAAAVSPSAATQASSAAAAAPADASPLRGAGLPRPPFATFLGSPTPQRPTSTSLPTPPPETPTPSRPSNT